MEHHRPRLRARRPLVLMVDDDEASRATSAYALSAMGFDIVLAGDGVPASTRAWEEQPDIILMKVARRSGDGWTELRDLKRDSRTRAIPIVAVTGDAEPSVRERARLEGCAAVCVMSCVPDKLALGLRAVLDRTDRS